MEPPSSGQQKKHQSREIAQEKAAKQGPLNIVPLS